MSRMIHFEEEKYDHSKINLKYKISWLIRLSNILSRDVMKIETLSNLMVAEKLSNTIQENYKKGLSLWRSFTAGYAMMLYKENDEYIPWFMATILTDLLFGIFDLFSEEMNTCIVRYSKTFVGIVIGKTTVQHTHDLIERWDYVENFQRRMTVAQPLEIYGFHLVPGHVSELKRCALIVETMTAVYIDNEKIVDIDKVNNDIDNTVQVQYVETETEEETTEEETDEELSTTISYSMDKDTEMQDINKKENI